MTSDQQTDQTPQRDEIERVEKKVSGLSLPDADELEDTLNIAVTESGVAIMTMNANTEYGSVQRREVCGMDEMEDVFRSKFVPYLGWLVNEDSKESDGLESKNYNELKRLASELELEVGMTPRKDDLIKKIRYERGESHD